MSRSKKMETLKIEYYFEGQSRYKVMSPLINGNPWIFDRNESGVYVKTGQRQRIHIFTTNERVAYEKSHPANRDNYIADVYRIAIKRLNS